MGPLASEALNFFISAGDKIHLTNCKGSGAGEQETTTHIQKLLTLMGISLECLLLLSELESISNFLTALTEKHR